MLSSTRMRWAAALSFGFCRRRSHLGATLTGKQLSNDLLFAGGKLWGLQFDVTHLEEPNLRRHLQRRECGFVIALKRAFELAQDDPFKLADGAFLFAFAHNDICR